MMNSTLLENEIRETFYNTMICIAMENNIGPKELNGLNRIQLLCQIISATLKAICETSPSGFYTIKNTHITMNNVPDYFKELYMTLEQIKKINNPQILNEQLRKITVVIMNKNLFSSIMNNVIDFYRGVNGEQVNQNNENNNEQNPEHASLQRYIRDPQNDPMVENIRQTFYDTMMIAVQHDNDIIKNEDVLAFEPYVAIGMPSLAIIYNIMNSMDTDGIKLISGHVITANNCPIYQNLFSKLFSVKDKIKNKNLDDNEFILLKYKCVNNPDIDLPDVLNQFNSPELNGIVANIIDIALDVSRLYNFQRNMLSIIQ